MSASNVTSVETDLAAPISVSTGESSWKAARAFRYRAVRSPKRAASCASSASCSWATVAYPSPASRSAVLGPMPGSRRVGAGAKRTHASSRPMATKPAGLPTSEQHLATSREGPTPTEIWIPVRVLTSATSSRSTRSGLAMPVSVRVRLVHAHLLHALQPLAHERPHLARLLAIGRVVGRDHDRVRAQPARLRGGHRGPHAELPRLVGRGRHD